MPILGPRSKFGTPFGLRGGESRGCVRRPKQNRMVNAESDFGLGRNLGIAKWVFSYSNSEFAYQYRDGDRRPKQKRRVNAEFGLANLSVTVF